MVFEILNYVKACPYLSDFSVNVDFLGKKINSLSLSGRAKEERVKVYTDGDSIVKNTYTLKLRLPYGVDMEKNRENSQLCENVSRWVFKQSEAGILPEFKENVPISVTAEFSRDDAVYLADTVIYTADLAVLYYKTKGF